MNLPPAALLYPSSVMHSRRFPVRYRFSYRIFSFLLDIDRLHEVTRQPLVSLDRFNVFSIHTHDHGTRDGSAWRPWVENTLARQGIAAPAHIRLLCMPRMFGYGFNPLSLWFCYNAAQEVVAVIAEVSNTFGEHHHYLLHQHGEPFQHAITASKTKIFHVSPFIGMQARYQFYLHPPGEQLRILIHEFADDALMLVASQCGKAQAFTTANLLRQLFSVTWVGVKVMALIHWQALKIWLQGAQCYRKPAPPLEEVS